MEIGAISMIAVCVLPPFYLIVLYDVPAPIVGFAEAYNIKKKTKTHPTEMFRKHPKLRTKLKP